MICRFYHSTIGKKFMVAVTGLVMFGFLIGHLAGNLTVFAGASKMNEYAAFLKASPILLWGTRVGLLVAAVLHVVATIQLTRLNRTARPIKYAEHEAVAASVPSRIMIWSGLLIAAYIVYHLLHFTVGSAHPHFIVHDVYANVISAFRNPVVSGIYIVAMILLGFHLHHGIWSVFQTLGLNHPKYNAHRRIFATVATLVIVGGFILIPVAVFFGGVR